MPTQQAKTIESGSKILPCKRTAGKDFSPRFRDDLGSECASPPLITHSRDPSFDEDSIYLTQDQDCLGSRSQQPSTDISDDLCQLSFNKIDSPLHLVIVGDLSGDKYSLLEGLTGMAFPTASDFRTRFVIHYTMKQSTNSERVLRASIIPGEASRRCPERAARLQSFTRVLKQDALSSRDGLGSLFAQVATLIYLPWEDPYDDILELEISGPGQTSLSLTDLPIQTWGTRTVLKEQEKTSIVDDIKHYLADKRTMILAPVDPRLNLATHEPFQIVRAADPDASRTICIMSKCDILRPLTISQTLAIKLHHGWFTMCSRSSDNNILDDVTMAKLRKEEQAIFSNAPWTTLDPARCGMKGLKDYLAQTAERLSYQPQRGVVSRDEFWSTAGALRLKFPFFANNYQLLLENLLNEHYGPGTLFSIRLRLHARLAQDFRYQMERFGHEWAFMTPDNTVDKSHQKAPFTFGDSKQVQAQFRFDQSSIQPFTVSQLLAYNANTHKFGSGHLC